MKRSFKSLQPPHYLYLAMHLVLFLLGIMAVQWGGPVWVGVGSSLIAAAVVGWVIFVYVFQAQAVADRLSLLAKFGFRNAFESRLTNIKHEYSARLKDAKRHIDLLGFGRRALREDFSHRVSSLVQSSSVRITFGSGLSAWRAIVRRSAR